MKKTSLEIIVTILISFSCTLAYADQMNFDTGEYIMDMGDGDQINIDTGEYYMDMGDGDQINIDTGEYYMNLD